jgi:hypothetical protein
MLTMVAMQRPAKPTILTQKRNGRLGIKPIATSHKIIHANLPKLIINGIVAGLSIVFPARRAGVRGFRELQIASMQLAQRRRLRSKSRSRLRLIVVVRCGPAKYWFSPVPNSRHQRWRQRLAIVLCSRSSCPALYPTRRAGTNRGLAGNACHWFTLSDYVKIFRDDRRQHVGPNRERGPANLIQ